MDSQTRAPRSAGSSPVFAAEGRHRGHAASLPSRPPVTKRGRGKAPQCRGRIERTARACVEDARFEDAGGRPGSRLRALDADDLARHLQPSRRTRSSRMTEMTWDRPAPPASRSCSTASAGKRRGRKTAPNACKSVLHDRRCHGGRKVRASTARPPILSCRFLALEWSTGEDGTRADPPSSFCRATAAQFARGVRKRRGHAARRDTTLHRPSGKAPRHPD